MSTSSNPQMTKVLVNKSRNRIATENDLAKFTIISVLQNYLDEDAVGMSEEFRRHYAKHLEAITAKLGAPEVVEAYVPKQKFVFAE
jgi:hypothetical protein